VSKQPATSAGVLRHGSRANEGRQISIRAGQRTITPAGVEVIVLDNSWLEPSASLPSPKPSKHGPQIAQHSWKLWGIRAGAALLTAGLHLLAASSLLVGQHSRKSQPPMSEGMAVAANADETSEVVSVLFIFNDNSVTPPEQRQESTYAIPEEIRTAVKETVSGMTNANLSMPEILGSDEGSSDSAAAAEATGDGAQAAMLFGRYMGQIKARIERAWQIPTAPSKESFDCKVQIRQSKLGEVQEVTLQRCDFAPEWQVSLVRAIQSASPLPAPPGEHVFTEIVTLTFAAQVQVASVQRPALAY
jgi:hypothetical protein